MDKVFVPFHDEVQERLDIIQKAKDEGRKITTKVTAREVSIYEPFEVVVSFKLKVSHGEHSYLTKWE
jgi:hypothetical protein